MTVKFNQYWSVSFDKTQDYEKFIIRKFIPGMNKLGIHIVAGWAVLVGAYPSIFLEGISNDLELLERALRDKKYKELNDDLQNYVRNYKTRVLVSTGKRIVCEGRAQDVDTNTLVSNLRSEKFQKAKRGLRQFIENYESRIFIFHIQKIIGYKSASYEVIAY
ncbi:MAG: hypothetical protein P8X80_08525 [Desulfobacterales bacterium]